MARDKAAIAAAAVALMLLGGCSTYPEGQVVIGHGPVYDTKNLPASEVGLRVESLQANRTDKVGDFNAVKGIGDAAGLRGMGEYTLSLQTATRPLSVNVKYTNPRTKFDAARAKNSAIIMLGFIKNLDRVTVKMGTKTFSLSTAQARNTLGFSVKDLPARTEVLRRLLTATTR